MGVKMGKYWLPFSPNVPVKIDPSPSHCLKAHYCIDFDVPCGTPVRAVRDGVVIFRESRFSKSYMSKRYMIRANVVVIRHTDGEESIYAHLQWRTVRVNLGQKIKRGQIIGLSGQTGYATYPHLHFGVYKGQKNIKIKFINRT
jgi:murein DD-endopeptidase MepM/ murein hydrolase activator NlpD